MDKFRTRQTIAFLLFIEACYAFQCSLPSINEDILSGVGSKSLLSFSNCPNNVAGRSKTPTLSLQMQLMPRRNILLAGAGIASQRILSADAVPEAFNMQGKTVVITGGNAGLGFEAAKSLAACGAEVIIGCRSPQRGASAVEKLMQEGKGKYKVSASPLDLSSFASIESFANNFKSQHGKLDILMNNAGVMALPKKEQTQDGLEMQIGINHFGHFLLTNLLMDPLLAAGREGGDARIVTLSSQAHLVAFKGVNLAQPGLEDDGSYSAWGAYAQSKLANILFTRELQSRLGPASGVAAMAVHPGVVRTELGRYFFIPAGACDAVGSYGCTGELGPLAIAAFTLATPLLLLGTKSPAQGAETQIRCAADPTLAARRGAAGGAGKYYAEGSETTPSAAALDAQAATALWARSEELTRRPFPVARQAA